MVRTATLCALVATCLTGAPPAEASDGARTAAAEAPLLFVQTVESGSLSRNRSGRLFLRLTVSPWTHTFTDRPQREAGRERTSAFVRRWAARGFRSDPPNAALSIDARKPGSDVVSLRLSRPRYDHEHGVLRYAVRPLHRTGPIRFGRFKRAALFIDDAGSAVQTTTHSQLGVKACAQDGQLDFSLSLSGSASFQEVVFANYPWTLQVTNPTTANVTYRGPEDPNCSDDTVGVPGAQATPLSIGVPITVSGDFTVSVSDIDQQSAVKVNLGDRAYRLLLPGAPVSFGP